MSSVPLTLDHCRALAAWLTHGPATVRTVAGRSDFTTLELHPATLDLLAVGALRVAGETGEGGGEPLYAHALSDLNTHSPAEVAARAVNTLPIRDQVSIAAGIMARHGKRGAAAREASSAQTALPGV